MCNIPSVEKICIFCQHYDIILPTCRYSSYTPGSELSIQCTKKIWDLYIVDTYGDYAEAMQTAKTCGFFEPVDLTPEESNG